ncbi:sugar transferase [Lutispora saccharofermentans]|uniref:Sugar transferase n=1 Tax=Lutispora saccharofermentans TaxID=3024236 RepID=A0ABT1ND30_9FIRM|nr:sugar transferase [Lutispora saccharofermentans]MCQ1529168.1 sugar transferase [Lutispora saccharofermentans]
MKSKFKRFFDIVASFTLIMLLLPVYFIVAIVVAFSFGFPILFKQSRPGLYGKIFDIYKFRTMLNSNDRNGNLLSDAERLTSVGKFLRSTSLDELPEFFNVLRGDMSLVGPRPLLVEYLDKYTLEQARRHEVRPGITGWAQVNGRNAISWEEKFKLDVWYVDNWSLWLDFKILIMTVIKVFRRDGISSENHATMEKFQGYNDNGVGM